MLRVWWPTGENACWFLLSRRLHFSAILAAQLYVTSYNLCKYLCKLCANIHHSQGRAQLRITYDRAHTALFRLWHCMILEKYEAIDKIVSKFQIQNGEVWSGLSLGVWVTIIWLWLTYQPTSSLMIKMCNLILLTSLTPLSLGRLLYWLFQQQPISLEKLWHTPRPGCCVSVSTLEPVTAPSSQRRETLNFFLWH